MITLNFALSNPYSHRWDNVISKHKRFSKYKVGEIQVVRNSSIVAIAIDIIPRGDHAGIMFEFGIFGYNLMLSFYDTRHWDYENNCWYVYEEYEQ